MGTKKETNALPGLPEYQAAATFKDPEQYRQSAISCVNGILERAIQIKNLLQLEDPTEKDLLLFQEAGETVDMIAGRLRILLDFYSCRRLKFEDPPELRYQNITCSVWIRFLHIWTELESGNVAWKEAGISFSIAEVYQMRLGIYGDLSGLLIYHRNGKVYFTKDPIEYFATVANPI